MKKIFNVLAFIAGVILVGCCLFNNVKENLFVSNMDVEQKVVVSSTDDENRVSVETKTSNLMVDVPFYLEYAADADNKQITDAERVIAEVVGRYSMMGIVENRDSITTEVQQKLSAIDADVSIKLGTFHFYPNPNKGEKLRK